jgi:hypothetical protein
MIRTFDLNKIQDKGDGVSQSQNTLPKANGESYNSKSFNNHRRILSQQINPLDTTQAPQDVSQQYDMFFNQNSSSGKIFVINNNNTNINIHQAAPNQSHKHLPSFNAEANLKRNVISPSDSIRQYNSKKNYTEANQSIRNSINNSLQRSNYPNSSQTNILELSNVQNTPGLTPS